MSKKKSPSTYTNAKDFLRNSILHSGESEKLLAELKKNSPNKNMSGNEMLEKFADNVADSLVGLKTFKYFNSLKDMILHAHGADILLEEIEEIERPSLELLREVDRWSTPDPNSCYFWLMCKDNTEFAGGNYLHLIATIRVYKIKGNTEGPIVLLQRFFTPRTDMTNALTYAPIEIYMRVVEEFYKEHDFNLVRGESSFLFSEEGHQGAYIGWQIGVPTTFSVPALFVLHEQIGILQQIEERYASRMAYMDKSQIDESNPWIVILENLKSMDKKMEDALSKNKTTIYGDVRISKGDFVGGDKVTNIHNNSNIFSEILVKIDEKNDLSKAEKVKLKSEITELEGAVKNTQPDEGFIKKRLQVIKKMAPDIFEVTISTILNPVSGLGTVVKKIAEKMKEATVK
ncbi:MAG: hypothetical protein L6Q45_12680 [Anaerolineales bacterium]|nr:hypothetical protein [Anaerolineales bacterium]